MPPYKVVGSLLGLAYLYKVQFRPPALTITAELPVGGHRQRGYAVPLVPSGFLRFLRLFRNRKGHYELIDSEWTRRYAEVRSAILPAVMNMVVLSLCTEGHDRFRV